MSAIDIDGATKRRKSNVDSTKQNEQVLTDDDSSSDGNEEDEKEDNEEDNEETTEQIKESEEIHVSLQRSREAIQLAFENSLSIQYLKSIDGTPFENRVDGCIYKDKNNEKVVYFKDHKLYYTSDILLQEDSYILRGFLFRHYIIKICRGYKYLIVLLEDANKTCLEPLNQKLHPYHIFRVQGRNNEYIYRTGAKKGVAMTLMPEYTMLKNTVVKRCGARTCEKHPDAEFSIRYDLKYCRYTWYKCTYCNRESSLKLHHAKIQTIQGKADILAHGAIKTQNKRIQQNNPGDIKFLTTKEHKAVFTRVLVKLIDEFLQLDAAKKMKLEPYHVTLDKIDDDKIIYMCETDDGYDFSNISVTVTLNNPPIHVDSDTKKRLCAYAQQIRSGMQYESAISPEYLKALEEVKKQLNKGSGARYTSNLARKIAEYLNQLTHHAKFDQNHRRTIKGRETMNEFTDTDKRKLKIWMIDNYIETGGRCCYSKIPICFAGLDGCPTVSIDRIDNDTGYEDQNNIRLIAVFFQSELRQTKGEEFVHLKWDEHVFMNHGDKVFGNKLVMKYDDLQEDVRKSLERK